jgi:hypothetical protein
VSKEWVIHNQHCKNFQTKIFSENVPNGNAVPCWLVGWVFRMNSRRWLADSKIFYLGQRYPKNQSYYRLTGLGATNSNFPAPHLLIENTFITTGCRLFRRPIGNYFHDWPEIPGSLVRPTLSWQIGVTKMMLKARNKDLAYHRTWFSIKTPLLQNSPTSPKQGGRGGKVSMLISEWATSWLPCSLEQYQA